MCRVPGASRSVTGWRRRTPITPTTAEEVCRGKKVRSSEPTVSVPRPAGTPFFTTQPATASSSWLSGGGGATPSGSSAAPRATRTTASSRRNPPMCRTVASAMAPASPATARSRLSPKRVAVCASRSRAASVRSRARATSALTTTPTRKSPRNVSRYSVSFTAMERRGGTKNRSNAKTLRPAAAMAGPRPRRSAASTTATRYGMTRLVGET